MAASHASTSFYPELVLCFHHKLVTKDHASIMVLIRQVVGNIEKFFHNPQKYLGTVSLAVVPYMPAADLRE